MPPRKSVETLIAEKEKLEQQIAERQREEAITAITKTPAFKSVAKQITDAGLSDDETLSLFNVKKTGTVKRKTRKTVAKYKNPADPNQTWSGMGRKPKWIQEWIDSGKDLEELSVKQ